MRFRTQHRLPETLTGGRHQAAIVLMVERLGKVSGTLGQMGNRRWGAIRGLDSGTQLIQQFGKGDLHLPTNSRRTAK